MRAIAQDIQMLYDIQNVSTNRKKSYLLFPHNRAKKRDIAEYVKAAEFCK